MAVREQEDNPEQPSLSRDWDMSGRRQASWSDAGDCPNFDGRSAKPPFIQLRKVGPPNDGLVGRTGKSPFSSADWNSGRSPERAGASASRRKFGRSALSPTIPKAAIRSASAQLVQTRHCAHGPTGVATIMFGVQQSGRPEPWPRAGVAAMSVPRRGSKRCAAP